MSGDSNLAIGAALLRRHCEGEPDVRERIRKAMRRVDELWYTADEDLQFRSAVAAAMLESSAEERTLIGRSVAPLRAIAAAIAGVPVDMEAVLADTGEVIPLLGLWHEVRAEKGAT